MKYLLGQLQGLKEKLRTRALLLLDYDGTLTPIVERPELAVLPPSTRGVLKFLAKHFKVAIITGRSLIDVKKLVGLKGVYYAGNHGLEIQGLGVQLVRPEAKRTRPIIAKLCAELQGKLRQIKGTIVEDKGLTASVHYRLVAPRELKRLTTIFEKTIKSNVDSGEIRITRGKKVFEIRPNVDWDKGKVALWIIDTIDPKGELVPIYIGDDKTDEDAFLALKNRGITILVSQKPKKSHAEFYLRNVDEVKEFLRELVRQAELGSIR